MTPLSPEMENNLKFPLRAQLLTDFKGYTAGHYFQHAQYLEFPVYGPWTMVLREDGTPLSIPAGLTALELRYFEEYEATPREVGEDKNAELKKAG